MKGTSSTKMRYTIVVLVIAVLLVGIAIGYIIPELTKPPPPPPVKTATITGKITDAKTGLPIKGATVKCDGYSGTTGADGVYSLTVPFGDYKATVSMTGYETQTISVSAPKAETYIVNIALKVTPPTVKVGLLWPVTGALALIGRDQVNAFSLFIDEVNAAGGIKAMGGARIEWIIGDTKGDPKIGAAEAERLITEAKVHVLVGAYQSAVTSTCSEVSERYGTPFLNPDSTSPGLTARGFKWFFRATPHDALLVKNMIDFVADVEKKEGVSLKKIALVYENTLWGIDTANVAREYAPTKGFTIVLDMAYSAGAADLSSEVLKLKATEHDVLLQASYLSDAILFTKTFKTLGYWPKMWVANDAGHIHPDYAKTLGKDADYVFSREVFCADLGAVKPAIKTANDKFRAKYGYNMDGTMARAYTAATLLVDVLERAGSIKAADIQKAFKETDISEANVPMPWRGIKFDDTGQNIKGVGILVQIVDGVSHTIWPFEVATTPYKWPVKAPWS